jgi:hypothetical protein
MWQLAIHCLLCQSSVILIAAIAGNTCTQPTMFPMQKAGNATATGACLTSANFELRLMLPEFSGIVVTAWANQY